MPDLMKGSDWAAEYMVHLAAAYIQADATQSAREVLANARVVAESTGSKRVLYMIASRERQLAKMA